MPTTKVKLLQPLRGNDNTDSKMRDLIHATHVALLWLAQSDEGNGGQPTERDDGRL